MKNAITLANYTLIGFYRKNFLLAFIIIQLFFIISFILLDLHNISLQAKIIKNISYNLHQIVGVIIILILTTDVVNNDCNGNLAYFYFAKDPRVFNYIVGKFLALAFAIFLFGMFNFLNFFLFLFVKFKLFCFELFWGSIVVILWQTVYCSIVFLISIVFSKILTISLGILALFLCFWINFIEVSLIYKNINHFFTFIAYLMCYIIPDFNLYNLYYSIVHEINVDYRLICFLFFYSLVYVLFFLGISAIFLKNKEF